ncbi:hypothetical protein JYB62_05995 [Algoriphagus lutimaris]|uniref:DUF6992 family protein n=1 Tax=Algoriphagus lutimaris TaxID=613197 RepID=UPI00196AC2E3|nr:hypothetical protein [Algoriphagus lutimaris]MBN3519549.1 hypothetical protein [Algoriphagus lutimaris]
MKYISLFFLVTSMVLFIHSEANSQEIPALGLYNETRTQYNESGMIILGAWALGNMVWVGIGASSTSGQTKAFHQMNLYWNSVNLIIAGIGYWQATREIPSTDLLETMKSQASIEKILLVNAALDIAYMAGGLYLKERGLRLSKDKFVGFGKSIILQGAFLFTFDALLYTFHVNHSKELPAFFEQVSFHPTGLALSFPLSK